MRKNGFTLIELLGVVVIMGIILLVAIPSTVKLVEQNANKKYSTYYDLIEEAAKSYADTRKDDLGGSDGSGCIEVGLQTLIDGDFILPFDDSEVVCDTPTDLSQAKIRISNDHGKIQTQVSLVCTRNRKVVYENVQKVSKSCDAYIPKDENILVTALNENLLGNVTQDGTTFYVTGTNPKNYVLYSGKLWRVISYDMNSSTVKMISDDIVGVGSYASVSGKNYLNSNILSWLENQFIQTLRDTDRMLSSETWNYTTVTSSSKPANVSTRRGKIGLLNLYEYSKVKAASYLNNTSNWWLLSPYNNNESWYVAANTENHTSVTSAAGIRPVITLQPQMTYLDSTTTDLGSKTNPYRVRGELKASVGTKLNTRYAGEYVTFDGRIYRIASTSSESTKLILNSVLDTTLRTYDTSSIEFSSVSTLGTYLNTTWYNSIQEPYKSMMVDGEWCIEPMDANTLYQSACGQLSSRTSKVGIPRYGEIYANPIGYEYWTLNSSISTAKSIQVLLSNGMLTQKTVTDTSYVRPAIYLDKNVTISSGQGTEDSPYQITK